MPVVFDRNVCCDLNKTISREWLVSNGLGGYAAGTVAGVLTRMQHGLLVSSPFETETPHLLLAKIDEEVLFDDRTYYLGTNEYREGTLNPGGFVHLESFSLEEGFPVFTYRIGGIDGILLQKRIWMPRGQNTTCIQYRVVRNAIGEKPYPWPGQYARNGRYQGYVEAAQRQLTLKLLPLAAYRPYDQPQYGNNDWHFQLQVHHSRHEEEQETGESADEFGFDRLALPEGIAACTIRATPEAHPYHLFAIGAPESDATFIPTGVWYWHFLRRHDESATRQDDLYLPVVIRATLWPDEESMLTIVVTTEETSSIPLNQKQWNLFYRRSVEQRRSLIQPQRYFGEGGEAVHKLQVLPLETMAVSTDSGHSGQGVTMSGEEYLKLLLQAGDSFLVSHRVVANASVPLFFKGPEYVSLLLSNYYGMQCGTRETLIALPGLTLATGRYEEAMHILRGIARHFRQGLLPDRLPLPEQSLQESDYGNVDATLWYFYALDAYLRVTRHYELLEQVYHSLADSIQWYIQGTGNGIGVDEDGLLQARQAGKALTWMNGYADSKPVTPRAGKPVEVNALWYNALSLMHEWSGQHRRRAYAAPDYEQLAARCKESFQRRFWHASGEYLYDVVDGPDGDDAALRPNQLLAVSLRYPVLDTLYSDKVVEQVTKRLLTPCGLRTLAPQDAAYRGSLSGEREQAQYALHQGSAWPWLLGAYIDALLNIYRHRLEKLENAGNAAEDRSLFQEYLWRQGLQLLVPFQNVLQEGMIGMIGAAYGGEAPHLAGDEVASALSVGEILRIYNMLARAGIRYQIQTLSA